MISSGSSSFAKITKRREVFIEDGARDFGVVVVNLTTLWVN